LVRLVRSFTNRRHDADFDLEIQSHLQMQIDDEVLNGVDPEEARRRARVRMGGINAVKEARHDRSGIPAVEILAKDVVYALRTLVRNKGWTTVTVLSLALGIGANTALFSVFQSVAIDELDVTAPEQLVAFRWGGPNTTASTMYGVGYTAPDPVLGTTQVPLTMPLYREFRDTSRTLDTVFAFAPTQIEVAVLDEEESVEAQYVSGTYYPGLGIGPVLGRLIGPADDALTASPVAVISEPYWRTRFGADPNIIGRTLQINDTPVVVIGVAPGETGDLQRVGKPTRSISIPLELEPRIRRGQSLVQNDSAWWLQVMGRMDAGTSIAAVQTELAPALEGLLRRQTEDANARIPELIVVSGARGTLDPTATETTALAIMAGVFGIVLVIVCVNVVNLLLSRNETRQREIAVRSAIGASRSRLIRQFLTEGMVLTGIGAVAAVGVAHLGLALTPVDLVRSRVLDPGVLSFVAGLTLIIGTSLGIVSAIGSSRPARALDLSRGHDAANPSSGWTGRSLVVCQVALSMTLVIGAGLFLRTLDNLRSEATGFNPDNLAVLWLGGQARDTNNDTRSRIYERIATLPGVESVSGASDALFGSGQVQYGFRLDADDPASTVSVPTFWVGSQFLEVQQIALRSGRGFTAADERSASPVAVVTEAFVREFFDPRGVGPIGYRMPVPGADAEIVGVTADVKYGNLRESARPMVYIVDAAQTSRLRRVLIRTSIPPEQVMGSILEAAQTVSPDATGMAIESQRQEIMRTYRNERLYAVASSVFGGLALAVSMVGLFGLLSFAVARRTREIGIRMALGAQKTAVLRSVLLESLALVSGGVALGLAGAFALTRYIESLLYDLRPNDPATLSAATGIMLAVGILAAFLPARRAAGVDPMVALRHD
jgi:predicted permease